MENIPRLRMACSKHQDEQNSHEPNGRILHFFSLLLSIILIGFQELIWLPNFCMTLRTIRVGGVTF